MFSLRQTLLSLLCLTLPLTGCATAASHTTPMFLPVDAKPSPGAMQTFAYLKMEQAMRRDDMPGLLEAANSLLTLDPTSRPLADASGWLLGNRYVEEARKLLEAAVKAMPDDLSLHIMLAETLLEDSNTDDALRLMRTFSVAHADNASARTELALLYLKMDRPKEALSLFNDLPTAARNPTVRYYYAQALRADNDLAGAAAMLESALAEAPDFLEAILELALLEEQRGRFIHARELYEQLLTYDEGNQDILLRLVAVALKEGNPDRALEIAFSVPDSFGFALTVASMFMEEGRYDLAGSLLEMLAKKPSTPREIVFYQAAVAYEGLKKPEKALELLSTITPENRYYDKTLKMRIQILFEKGDPEQALAVARDAQKTLPDDMDFPQAIIEILSIQKRYVEAQAAAEELMLSRPDDMELAFRNAYLLELQGFKAEALAKMEAILKHGDNAQVMNYIGYTLADENRELDRALELLLKAVELSPGTDYMLDSLAWVYYRLGQYPKAWEHIQHALSLAAPDRSQDATMWDHYGDIAKAMNLPAQARQGWEKALELNAEHPEAIRAKLERL